MNGQTDKPSGRQTIADTDILTDRLGAVRSTDGWADK